MDKIKPDDPKELRRYVDSLEGSLVAIHGYVTGALKRAGTFDDEVAREVLGHVQALVERILPEVLQIKAMMEDSEEDPPVVQ